jgi:hypothetical protein
MSASAMYVAAAAADAAVVVVDDDDAPSAVAVMAADLSVRSPPPYCADISC